MLALMSSAGCSTLADSGGGEKALPNAQAGPFRELRQEELGNARVAPFPLRDDDDFPRDPCVIDADGDPATLAVIAYVAHTVLSEGEEPDPTRPPNAIVRFSALDGRSFDRSFETVLEPEAPWEGTWIGAPAALSVDGEIRLYYAAEGGIGVARSLDGVGFERVGELPVLAAAQGWDEGARPTSPAVVALGDGTFAMFYEVELAPGASAIGEARSSDGFTFERVGDGPLLAPRGPSGDPDRPHADAESAGAPFALTASSATGRSIQYLYYAAVDEAGERSIAMAARFGERGPLSRAASPVYSGDGTAGEPWVLRYPDFALLFATQKAGSTEALDYPAVAAAVAPADVALPPPDPP